MRANGLAATLASVLALSPMVARAEPADMRTERMRDIVAALKAKDAPAAVFTPTFIAAVPPSALAALVRQIEAQHGRLLRAEGFAADTPSSGHFTLLFARARASATFSIEANAPHRVTGLRISAVTPIGDSPEKIATDFAALPGRSGFAVIALGDQLVPILAGQPDAQFAVGSTFKLWVLDALAEDVAVGRRRWDDVVRLGPRSLPSGMMQDWPPDAPVTIETLATMMISVSDNTATDTLIRLVGRERVAERVRATGHSDPARMLPLLTTEESFALKLSPPALQAAWARADDAGQAQMLAQLDVPAIIAAGDVTALDAAPVAIDSVEWFASPMDIARVLDALRRRGDPRVLEILGVAPAMAGDLNRRFAYVGYKGGSEVGVLALSWLVRRPSGQWLAVTASWNDTRAAVDAQRFGDLVERLVRLAARN